MSDFPPLQAILVCQGAEYRAVCAGLRRVKRSMPDVVSMPMGHLSLQFLETWQPPSRVLVAGLCGSLTPCYGIGATVLYRHCLKPDQAIEPQDCDRSLTQQLQTRLHHQVALVSALTSDRIIYTAAEKQRLAQRSGADVVDMEGFAVLERLQPAGVKVAMLRVVSDDCRHDLPDLTAAFSPEGALLPQPLAIALLRQPVAAARLIQGSLQSLKVLQDTIAQLFTSTSD